jgi:ubiquinone/menaquinone biosynthesis C-methylase UbiE
VLFFCPDFDLSPVFLFFNHACHVTIKHHYMPESWNSTEKFNREALEWDNKPERQLLARAVAQAIITAVKPDSRMNALEIGCGTGLVSMEIAPLVNHLTAIDTSPEMLGVLNHKIRNAGTTNIETICLDLASLSQNIEPDKKFDLIYCSMTLHHIDDTGTFIGSMAGHLTSGGVIAIADLDQEDGTFHDDPQEKVHHGFNRSYLDAVFQNNGLQVNSFETAYIIEKVNPEGLKAAYPVFLACAGTNP